MRHGFDYDQERYDADLDYLLNLCEYCYNFALALGGCSCASDSNICQDVINHIDKLVDKLCYTATEVDDLVVFVPRNANVMAAAEVAPPEVAFDLTKYDYRKYEGDLDSKKAILIRLIGQLEPKHKRLESLARDATRDLFFIANNLNLRHNNVDASDAGKFKRPVAEMNEAELEGWYDLCRDLCAVSFLLLGHDAERDELQKLKNSLLDLGPVFSGRDNDLLLDVLLTSHSGKSVVGG